MKFAIVLCALLAIALADRPEYEKNRDACIAEEKVSDTAVEKIKNKEYTDDAGCYYRCLLTKMGVWDDTKGYDVDKSVEKAERANMVVDREVVKKCAENDAKDDDNCKRVAKISKCVLENKAIRVKN